MNTYAGLQQLEALVGEQIGSSGWIRIEQSRIQHFADATDDHQWIHLDVDRAKEGPFKSTIAHGFLTLSLLPRMMSEAYSIGNIESAINYGLNRVRFPAPVPSGARVRAHFTLLSMEAIAGGSQVTVEVTVELEGSSKPACVAESVARLFPVPALQA